MVPTVQMETIFFHLTQYCQLVKWSHAVLCQRKACPMDQMDQMDQTDTICSHWRSLKT
jgi:hypothetical protein